MTELDIYDLNYEQLHEYIKIMYDDLQHVVMNHKADCKLSDRDIDDIESLLVDLRKPISYKELI